MGLLSSARSLLSARSRPDDADGDAAPADWEARATAVFEIIDKEGAGYITTVPTAATGFCSELSVLGEDALFWQKAAGDFELVLVMELPEWISSIKSAIQCQGWPPVGELLQAVQEAACNGVGKKEEVEHKARAAYAALSDAPDTASLDIVGAVESLCLADQSLVRVWCKSLLRGLEPGTPLSIDEWVAHCEIQVESLGWPRMVKHLTTVTSHAERAKNPSPRDVEDDLLQGAAQMEVTA